MTHPEDRPTSLIGVQLREEVLDLLGSDRGEAARCLIDSIHPHDQRDRAEIALLKGMVLRRLGQLHEARKTLVRGLRDARPYVGLRAEIRSQLASVLIRQGMDAEAERILQKALADLDHMPSESWVHVWILNELGIIQRRRGSLTIARRLFERSIANAALLDGPKQWPPMLRRNLALTMIHAGKIHDARFILDDLARQVGRSGQPVEHAAIQLSLALLHLETAQLEACDRALAMAGEMSSGLDMRTRVILGEYTADLRLAQESPKQAIELLQPILAEAREMAPLSDLVAEIARRMATALLAVGRAEEALDHAHLAARTGRRSDVLEWAAGLRVAAECHAALGRRGDAAQSLAEAESVLQTTEFVAEHRRLDATRRRLGFASEPSDPRRETPGTRGTKLSLADGRALLTQDKDLVAAIEFAATDDLPVLIEGETGTGKELVARLVHDLGPRPQSPFVIVDCTVLPEALTEGELFGTKRGAYTGAAGDRTGLVAAAHGGTLFLDELHTLPPAVQSKLLRVLQDGSYRPLGDNTPRRASVRVVAAVSPAADPLVQEGRLKLDLFQRLNAHRLSLAPLRDRLGEVPFLAHEFARRVGLAGVTDEALQLMARHEWPGNVRELELLIRMNSRRVRPGGWLDEAVIARDPRFRRSLCAPPGTGLRTARDEGERKRLRSLLRENDGNISAAARGLGMTRQGLWKALKRHDLT